MRMKLAVFTPFGTWSRETGVIYLLINYLEGIYPGILQLRCNGSMPCCALDAERNWKRNLDSCFNCIAEQDELAAWSRIHSADLSHYLTPDDVLGAKRWVVSLSDKDLMTAEFNGQKLFDVCAGLFKERFGEGVLNLSHKTQAQFLRQLLLCAARMQIACDRFYKQAMLSHIFLTADSDYMTSMLFSRATLHNVTPVRFTWDLHTRTTNLKITSKDTEYSCDLLLENVTTMRSDPSTWASELLDVIRDMVSYLGFSDTQLSLPLK